MKTGVRFQVSRHGGPSADVAFQLPGGRFMILSFLCALCVFVVSSTVFAQSTPSQVEPNNTTGTPPFGSFGGQNENINLANGNLNLSIPLFSFGARGMGFSLNATYDSKIWHPTKTFDEFVGNYFYDWDQQIPDGIVIGPGWRLGLPVLSSISKTREISKTLQETWYEDFVITMPDGSRHKFERASTRVGDIYPKIVDSSDGKVEFTYETYTVPDDATFTTEDGNVIEKREWDFVPLSAGFSAAPSRRTVRTYLKTNPVNGTNYRDTSIFLFLFSLVSSESIQDGIATQLARTDFGYDNYAGPAGPLVDRPAITGHDTAKYSTGYVTRGNLENSHVKLTP